MNKNVGPSDVCSTPLSALTNMKERHVNHHLHTAGLICLALSIPKRDEKNLSAMEHCLLVLAVEQFISK